MYLQFSSGQKKLNSYGSMPNFKQERPLNSPAQSNIDSPPKPLPFLNVNINGKGSESKQPPPTTLSFCYTDRNRVDEIADDLLHFKSGIRNNVHNPQESHLTDRPAKHKILKKHLARPDKPQIQYFIRDESASRVSLPKAGSPLRQQLNFIPFYNHNNEPSFLSHSRLEASTNRMQLSAPVNGSPKNGQISSLPSTLNGITLENRFSSPEKE